MIYFTSDCHLFHKRILDYEEATRPFTSIEAMNEYIITIWNRTVKPEDEVYVLGDFIMGDIKNVEYILSRLNGHITLVRGNHDTPAKLEEYKRLGVEVKDIVYIPYKGRFFIGCHFPMNNEEFINMVRKDNSEVVWLYGHIHSNAPKGYVDGTYHIGMDTNDLAPISIEQIWQESWPEEIMTPEIEAYKIAHMTLPNLDSGMFAAVEPMQQMAIDKMLSINIEPINYQSCLEEDLQKSLKKLSEELTKNICSKGIL